MTHFQYDYLGGYIPLSQACVVDIAGKTHAALATSIFLVAVGTSLLAANSFTGKSYNLMHDH